jgi:hypothetical protein
MASQLSRESMLKKTAPYPLQMLLFSAWQSESKAFCLLLHAVIAISTLWQIVAEVCIKNTAIRQSCIFTIIVTKQVHQSFGLCHNPTLIIIPKYKIFQTFYASPCTRSKTEI